MNHPWKVGRWRLRRECRWKLAGYCYCCCWCWSPARMQARMQVRAQARVFCVSPAVWASPGSVSWRWCRQPESDWELSPPEEGDRWAKVRAWVEAHPQWVVREVGPGIDWSCESRLSAIKAAATQRSLQATSSREPFLIVCPHRRKMPASPFGGGERNSQHELRTAVQS